MPTRRIVAGGLAALPAATWLAAGLPAFAQSVLEGDTVPTTAGDVTIHPVGHATLILGFGDSVIYVDPAESDFAGLPAATAILFTHAHGDHFNAGRLAGIAGAAPILATEEVAGMIPADLAGQVSVLRNGESGEIDGIPVEAVAAYNTTPERQQYHPQGVGNGYVLSFGDTRIYVAGDTEDTPEMRALTDIAVAFLPMNLPYTMTEEQAADAVAAFRPAIVYPYHFRGSDVDRFRELVGDAAEVRLADWYPAGG